MLLQRRVNYSTFPAEFLVKEASTLATGGYSAGMRIELPSTTWADTLHRSDDDAHTLTVSAQPAPEWSGVPWTAQAEPLLRVQVAPGEALVLTLTF